MKHLQLKKHLRGFTIIELLVVVVVIAIIAAVTFVVYSGVTKNAYELSLKSDLTSASETLKTFKATHSSYPTTINCSTGETSTNTCIKASDGNTYISYISTTTTFRLIEKNNPTGLMYQITDNIDNPVAFSGSTVLWTSIAAGAAHTCALTAEGRGYCWGYNHDGELGNNSTANSSVPVAVYTSGILNGKKISLIAAGYYHTCALTSEGKAYCWGANGSGQLGNNSTANSSTPVAVDTSGALNGKTLISITASLDHTCALTSEGKAYCWGANGSGELGNNSRTNSSTPVAVDTSGLLNGKTLISITTGLDHTCALTSEGKAYCWGYNAYGELGNNSTTYSRVPVAIDTSGALSGETISSITAGYYHTCALTSEGKAYCWGDNEYGQLGNNSTTNSLVPAAVDTSGVLNGKRVASIAYSPRDDHTCALTSEGKAYCWGANGDGQFGTNSTISSLVPVTVDTSGVLSGKKIISITTGEWHTCALTSEGKAYCWGANGNGQLGNNLTTQSSIPVAVVSVSL